MDIARPASVVLPAGTESVLRVLSGSDGGQSVRGIARLAGISPNRASQVVTEFAEHGLVLIEELGGVRLCRLNREHLAAEPLLALVGLRARLLDAIRHEIATWEPRPLHVSLFGSAARRDGTTRSDLDILVVRPDGLADGWDGQLVDSGERIRAMTGNQPAWFVTTTDDLGRARAAGEPIIGEWRRDGIHLFGRRLEALLRGVA